jgi:hypothetical protein
MTEWIMNYSNPSSWVTTGVNWNNNRQQSLAKTSRNGITNQMIANQNRKDGALLMDHTNFALSLSGAKVKILSCFCHLPRETHSDAFKDLVKALLNRH